MNAEDKALFLRVIDFLDAHKNDDGEWSQIHNGDIENMVDVIQNAIDYNDEEEEAIPTMDMFKEKEFEICDEEEEEEAEEVVKQLPDGTIINCCDECPHCTRIFEPGISWDEAVEEGLAEDYYGMAGGCGTSGDLFYECWHPKANEMELNTYRIDEEIDETCPLEDAPKEEKDE